MFKSLFLDKDLDLERTSDLLLGDLDLLGDFDLLGDLFLDWEDDLERLRDLVGDLSRSSGEGVLL